ncbi:MAG: hypothetical protein ACREQ3_09575, partial [Candidatus Binatia bacterium]
MSGTKRAAVVVLCLWSAWASVSFAQIPEDITSEEHLARETLRGLTGVAVTIEDLAPQAERDGLSKVQLRGDVEQTLRQAQIRVLSEEERQATLGNPTLSVHVGTFKMGDVYSLCIEVTLKQVVILKRTANIERLVETWETKGVGTGGAFQLQGVRQGVIIKVGEFVTAYRAVNPQARPATTRPLLPEKRLVHRLWCMPTVGAKHSRSAFTLAT